MFKPLVYASTEQDVIGSEHVYGLKTLLADMSVDNTTYNVTYKDFSLSATFDNIGSFENASDSFENFQVYQDIMNLPWMCTNEAGEASCAYDNFVFAQGLARPSSMVMTFDSGILPGIEAGTYKTSDINTPLGTVQVQVKLLISPPEDCPN